MKPENPDITALKPIHRDLAEKRKALEALKEKGNALVSERNKHYQYLSSEIAKIELEANQVLGVINYLEAQ